MVTNASITIYHKTGKAGEPLKRIFIPECNWYADHRINVETSGVTGAEIYKVRIPREWLDGYRDPDEYLSSDTGWTVDNGDYFVKGEGPENVIKPSDIGSRFAQVRSWGDNRRGGLPHLRIEGW